MKQPKKVGGINLLIKIKKLILLTFLLSLLVKSSLAAVVYDYEVESCINKSINPIIKISKLSINEPYFYILLSKAPNAFIDESNRIFITTGFISTINYPEGLAGIVAHEIAHIKANHIQQRKSNIESKKSFLSVANIVSFSASIISNNPDIFIGSNIASNEIIKSNLSNFSKDQEREADILALQYLEQAKITSSGLKDILTTLILKMEELGIKESELNILTHPYKKERLNYINKFQLNSNHNNSYFNEEIQDCYKFIKAKTDGYTLDLEKIKLKYRDISHPAKKYALSISYAREGYINESIMLINELLIKYPDNEFFYETKGELLLSFGYSNEAYKFFNKSLNINNNNDYLRIKVIENLYYNMKSKNDAFTIIENFNLIKMNIDNNNKMLQIKSKVYGFLDIEDEMYYYLSKIELNNGNKILAVQYLELSLEKTNKKQLIKRIKILKEKINEK